MAKEYRYWWLKLEKDFFNRKFMKKLRRLDNGAVYTIIYLKMQLESLQNGGVLSFQDTEDTFEEELAFVIDEDLKDTIETVKFLKKYGLLVELTETANELELTEVVNNIDSEGASARRVRKYRSKASQSNEEASQSNEEALQCNEETSQNNGNDVTLLRREREEKEKYKETEKRESKAYQSPTSPTFSEPSVSVSSPSLLCGTFGNVSLTQVQLDWLANKYPDDYMGKIDHLSEYMYDTGKTYKYHFRKIREWAEQDEKKKKNLGKTGEVEDQGYDLESESKRPIPPKPDNVDMTDEEWKIHIEKLRE
ncbi:phage replisome organizer N-terminal domain-containing protein [Massilimaliae timonensis]|uniref:Phage replisome organizer N-terminal domain-containing protein n=1 Tax=Massiliimalia timonensis TaxID=1987501 RepID=A0A8J6TQ23_9FIRM|nr:phage replisome organizer N-terminal domain-containing protein [Massiliimalia timonensis]MBC8610794.1 phage replisome organizer N-terminal domain-containing protein [Massiliimalia timonensis]